MKQAEYRRTVQEALKYVSHVVDTALSPDHTVADVGPGAVLVGWQCGFEPLFVAVINYMTDLRGHRDRVDIDEAMDIAIDYLRERKWFADSRNVEPDYVYTVVASSL